MSFLYIHAILVYSSAINNSNSINLSPFNLSSSLSFCTSFTFSSYDINNSSIFNGFFHDGNTSNFFHPGLQNGFPLNISTFFPS